MPLPLSPPPLLGFVLQTVLLTAFPHGGQHRARQNAWRGMCDDAARLRAWREVNPLVTSLPPQEAASGDG